MSERLFGYKRSSSSTTTSDVIVTDYDDGWGLDAISTPVAFQKTWAGDDITIYGHNFNVPNSWEDCSNFNADNTYMTGILASGLMVSSNSSADQMISGGVHAICLEYLDTDWKQQKVNVELSGQKPIYIGDVFRPQRMYVVKVGSSGSAVGDIVLASGNNQYLKISSGKSISHTGYYYVAGGKELMITDSFCSPTFGCNAAMEFILVKEEPRDYNGTTYYIETDSPMGTTVATYTVMNMPLPVVMPYSVKEKCRLRLRVISNPEGGSGQSIIRGYLVDKKVG